MSVAFSGLGRMGGAIASRLREAGLGLRVYDASSDVRARFRAEGYDTRSTLREAASGAAVAMLCLPDAAAVEASVPDLLAAAPSPSLCIDLSSSEPDATRRVAGRLGAAGMAMIDSPVSGGVAGARAGLLTAMAGGEAAVVQSAERWLRPFAAKVLWAGPAGSGDAVKAINNALSAASLTATAEMYNAACRAGAGPAELVAALNAGHGRSQNSEVKFPAQVVTRRFEAGFATGLMLKDVSIALRIAAGAGLPLPFTSVVRELWAALAGRLGAGADFTRVVELYEEWSGPPGPGWTAGPAEAVERACRAVDLTSALATRELLGLAAAAGLEEARTLAIVNASTGRNEWTRDRAAGRTLEPGPGPARAGLEAGLELARQVGAPAPCAALALSIAGLEPRGG